MKNRKYIPKVGDLIYVDSSIYLSHGVDDFIGGLYEISSKSNLGKTEDIKDPITDPSLMSSPGK